VTEEQVKDVETTSPQDADAHLAHLLAPASIETPWFRSIFTSIKEAINPPKLPPLEVTSKPIEVPDVWVFYGGH
jgi:protein TonB